MNTKDTNPKDAVGVKKWRQFSTVPTTVLAEVGVGMLEGARKYGRHNYRVAGVRASVYLDASMGHLMQWWEGEDIDQDSGLSHVTKAICSLFVLRDAMIQGMLTDDRPPQANLDALRADLQRVVDEIFERHPDPLPAYTAKSYHSGGPVTVNISAGHPGEEPTVEVVQGDLTSGAHVTVNVDGRLSLTGIHHILRKKGWSGPQSHVKRDSNGEE